MSYQSDTSRARRSPLGFVLVGLGAAACIGIVAMTFIRIYDGTRATFGTIAGPEPTTIELSSAGTYILTRAVGLSDDRSLTVTVRSVRPQATMSGEASFVSDDTGRWITLKKQQNEILGDIATPFAGPVTISANASAYPLTVRRDPLELTLSVLRLSAVLGAIAIITLGAGIVISVREMRASRRERHRILDELTNDRP